MDELRYILKNSPFDVIGLNETLCDSMITDSLTIMFYFVEIVSDTEEVLLSMCPTGLITKGEMTLIIQIYQWARR